jgi:hypothetical protein
LSPLDPPDLLGIEGELKQEVRLRVTRELRVGDLVGAVRPKLDEVRNPAPTVGVDEDALVNDVVRAAADRVDICVVLQQSDRAPRGGLATYGEYGFTCRRATQLGLGPCVCVEPSDKDALEAYA